MGNHIYMLKLRPSQFVRKLYSPTPLANSVIVITGASSGIGKQLTERYAERGTRIVIGARKMDQLQQVRPPADP